MDVLLRRWKNCVEAAEARRFAQVRLQANRLLLDCHGAVLLPGATAWTARLLRDAREDLASLSASAADDPALLRDLGVAQRRLGVLYSAPGRGALGDVRASIALQPDAVALLARAQALQPASVQGRYQLALAEAALSETLREHGDAAAALPLPQSAGTAFDALALRARHDVSYAVEQVRTRLRLSRVHASTSGASLGQPARADALLGEAGALLVALRRRWPDDMDVAALFAATQNVRYLAAAREGRWADGLALLQALKPIFDQLVAREPDNALHARDAAIKRLSQGTALGKLGQLGRYAEARDASHDALTRMQAQAAADPPNRNAQRNVAKLQPDVGWASLQLDDTPAALRHRRPASQTLHALALADPRRPPHCQPAVSDTGHAG